MSIRLRFGMTSMGNLFLLHCCGFEMLQTPTKKKLGTKPLKLQRSRHPTSLLGSIVSLGQKLMTVQSYRDLRIEEPSTIVLPMPFLTQKNHLPSPGFNCLTAVHVSFFAAEIHRIAPTFGCTCHRSGPGNAAKYRSSRQGYFHPFYPQKQKLRSISQLCFFIKRRTPAEFNHAHPTPSKRDYFLFCLFIFTEQSFQNPRTVGTSAT